MAMKSPPQSTNNGVEQMMPVVASLTEDSRHLALRTPHQPQLTKSPQDASADAVFKKSLQLKDLGTFDHLEQAPPICLPRLLKMVTEPLSEYCKDSTPPPPSLQLGISRSQDDDYNDEMVERKFGSVSPIFHTSRGNLSSVGAARASNFRQRFRKSHTCGSLFANCNCSSTQTAHIPASQAPAPTSIPIHTQQRGGGGGGGATTIPTPSSFHLSVSPTNASDASIASSRLTTNTSGIWSLSQQTSSATSAQLSRDYDESFDFTALTGHASSFDHSYSGSLAAPKQAYRQQRSTETEARSTTLQISRISSTTSDTTSSSTSSTSPAAARRSERSSNPKAKRLFQSYSHPDTQFVFTDENKHPSRESLVQIHVQESALKSRSGGGGKVEIKYAKRSSSPNIGQYQILDVAVHPDILVKISPRHSPQPETRRVNSPLSARSTQQRRRLLQRSHEIDSGGSTSDSEPTLDVRSPTVVTGSLDLAKSLIKLQSPTTKSIPSPISPVLKPRAITPTTGLPAPSKTFEDISFNAAQKYFAESGILGPISTSIRKTSKILQDSNVIEQIRKTSMILRANTATNISRKTSAATSPTTPAGNRTATTPTSPMHHAPLPTPPSLTLKFAQNVNIEAPMSVINGTTSTLSTAPKSPNTMATTCSFSPNVITQGCNTTDDRDAQIKSLQGEIVSLKDVIKSRDADIVKLRREIHKLKSVLQQTTNHLPIANDDLLQSPPAVHANRCFLPPQCNEITSSQQPICVNCRKKLLDLESTETPAATADRLTPESNGSNDSNSSEAYQSCTSLTTTTTTYTAGTSTVTCALPAEKPKQNANADTALDAAATMTSPPPTAEETAAAASDSLGCNSNNGAIKSKIFQLAAAPVLKKQGVSGESCETSMQHSINVPIPKFDKDFSSKQLIKDAIMDNDFLKNIDASQVRELVESMYSLAIAKGEFVVREGEVGAHLYVSAEGEFEVVKNGKVLGIMGPGKAFGELAILYNCTRTASIRMLSNARVWVLDRRVFQQIMMRTGLQRIENSVNFLKSVPLLKNLSDEVLAKIADVLEVEFYPAGTYIIRQGASGDTFFLMSQGSVKVTQKLSPSVEEKEIRTLERGDYFGEQALINEDKRTANIIAMAPGVECLTLDRDSFTHLIGDLCELKEKNYGDENRVLAMKYAEKTKEIFGANAQQEFPDMKLTDLEVVATLGIGGFGRVELVKAYRENRVDTYALKCLKKRHIVDTKQEEHVFSERTIMLTCNTPFICRLHRTFRDNKYVYMMLEACMGGEIWTMLRDRGSFDENATQFIIGCVMQAFEYLHSRGIIYRDLKPENLMLDERGYVKLVDFGFAKHIGSSSSKTWTFCGTPEYVAPEIILNKGHDRAVDYWALGILIHELLNGTPPFTANDPMKTYNIILKGIDMIDFPKHMSRSAVQLIKKLCRDVPSERLGHQKGGIQDIKKHKWFLGFDWDGLQSQLLTPPFVRPIAHPTDTCYFDKFPCDPNETPDENSGWDADF